MPRSWNSLPETRQLAVLSPSCSAVFRVIYSREMARFLVYILEREPHYFAHPVICPLVVCPDPSLSTHTHTHTPTPSPSPSVGFLRFLGTVRLSGEAPLRGGVQTPTFISFVDKPGCLQTDAQSWIREFSSPRTRSPSFPISVSLWKLSIIHPLTYGSRNCWVLNCGNTNLLRWNTRNRGRVFGE